MPPRPVVLGGLAALALAAPAGAPAAGWRTPELVPLTAPAESPSVAADGHGDLLAVWAQTGNARSLWQPAGGAPQAPILIDSRMTPDGPPQFDAAGNAFVPLLDTSDKARLAELPAGASSWTVRGPFGTGAVTSAALAVTPDGTVRMLTAEGSGVLNLRTWAPGAASPVTDLVRQAPNGAAVREARLGVDVAGHLVAAWAEIDQAGPVNDTATLYGARRDGSGVWPAPDALDTISVAHNGGDVSYKVGRFAVSAAGTALLSWVSRVVDNAASQTVTTAGATTAQAGAGFELPAATLESRTYTNSLFNEIAGTAAAFDGERAMVAWFGQRQGVGDPAATKDVRVAYRAAGAGQPFSAAQDVSAGTEAVDSVGLTGRGGGGALAAAGTTGSVLASVGDPGATLPAAGTLISGQVSTSSADATAFGADGIVLSTTAGSTPILRLHIFDVTAPRLGDVTAPSAATVGQALAFSGSATDAWQPVAPHFDFGDGSGATGTDVAHFYSAPGAYTISVTASDDVGNAAAPAERAILVSPAPVPPVVNLPRPGLTNDTFATVAFQRFLARARRDGSFGSADVVCASRGGCQVVLTIRRATTSRKARRPARGSARTAATAKPLVKSTIKITGGRQKRVVFRLRGRALRTLVAARRLKLAVSLALRDGDGHARTVSRSVTVRAPLKKKR